METKFKSFYESLQLLFVTNATIEYNYAREFIIENFELGFIAIEKDDA